jgi:poly-beta-1,6-N-acetyl-D-glucosamine biosynthesis protein PgaD
MNAHDTIIEKPLSQSTAQRVTGGILTVLAWALLIYMLLPIAGLLIGEQVLPGFVLDRNLTSMADWQTLVPLIPWWAAMAIGLVSILYVWAVIQFIRFRNSRRRAVTAQATIAEMANYCGHPESAVQSWGAARRAVAYYDYDSEMMHVSVDEKTPFREPSKGGEPTFPVHALAQAELPEIALQNRIGTLKTKAISQRHELIELWAKMERLESLMSEIAENREGRENNRDVPLYAAIKEARANTLDRIKRLRRELAETRYLLEEQIAADKYKDLRPAA